MQPQEAGGPDWLHWILSAGGVLGFVGAALQWVFRAGGVAPKMQTDFKNAVDAAEKRIEDQMDAATQHFDETLRGLREKINSVELNTERHFLPKEDFNAFREEYRQDIRDIKAMVSK
jgi:cysteine sulfinate desulfinase/cysteine desulfurase-like protein